MIRLPRTEVTVPTLAYVTSPQPYCGLDTDDRTLTRLPTCSDCEHSDDGEEAEVQTVAPAVPHGKERQSFVTQVFPCMIVEDLSSVMITNPCALFWFTALADRNHAGVLTLCARISP